MILKIVVGLALALGFVVLIMALIHGVFAGVTIVERTLGPFEFVYRTAPGGDLGAVGRITTLLATDLQSVGVLDMRPLDVFYPSEAQDTEIGFTVSPAGADLAATLSNAPRRRTIPAATYLTTRFPYRTPLSFIGRVLEDQSGAPGLPRATPVPRHLGSDCQ